MDIFTLSDKSILGEALKKKRESKDLSKYHFQENGVRQELLNSIESGDKNYRIDSLLKYIEILNA